MAVRSRRLFSGTLCATDQLTTLYTVPAGRTLVLRTVTAFGYDEGPATNPRLYVAASGSSTAPIWNFGSVAQNSVAVFRDWAVLEAQNSLTVYVSGGRVQCSGFGALLLGDPT